MPQEFSLIGVPSSERNIFSSVVPNYGLRMERGNHLRWFINPKLGFPQKFILYRGGNKQDLNVNLSDVTDVASTEQYLRSIVDRNRSTIAEFSYQPLENPLAFYTKGDLSGQPPPEYYRGQIGNIQTQLNDLLTPSVYSPQVMRHFGASPYKKAKIKVLDTLLIASLDPFMARLLGLYFIDRNPTDELSGYYVVAEYGEQNYPLLQFDFRATPPVRYGTIGYKIGSCTLVCPVGNFIQSFDNPTKGLLFIDPTLTGNMTMILSFEEPVEEVHLAFEHMGSIRGSYKVILENGQELPRSQFQNHQLIINPIDDIIGSFKTVQIVFEQIVRIPIIRLSYREKRGFIGSLYSNVSIVDATSDAPFRKLSITALRQSTMPPILDASGKLNTQINKVKAAVIVEEEVGTFYISSFGTHQSIRYLLGKNVDGSSVPPVTYVNPEEPALLIPPDSTFLGMLLYFDFSGKNFTNIADNFPAEVRGRFSFANIHFRSLDLGEVGVAAMPQFTGQQCLVLNNFESVRQETPAFTIGATVSPTGLADGASMTIVDYNIQTSLWFGLVRRGNLVFIQIVLNGVIFSSNQYILLDQRPPRRLVVNYNGTQMKMYIDASPPDVFQAPLGVLAPNPMGKLAIGGDIHSQGDIQSGFIGYMNDVHFWAKEMTPYAVKKCLIDQRTSLVSQEIDSPYRRNVFSFTEHFVPDNNYTYFAKGIDIFGRMNEWSDPLTINVRASPSPPNAPQSVKAKFLLWNGTIRAIPERRTEDGAILKPLLTTIDGKGNDFGKHDVVITRHNMILEHWPDNRSEEEIRISRIPKGRVPYSLRQKIEIFEGEANPLDRLNPFPVRGYAYDDSENMGLLTIKDNYLLPPFAQMTPQVGDEISIELDNNVEVEWQWTGLQQVYNPNVDRFFVLHLSGKTNEIEVRIQSVSRVNDSNDFDLIVVGSSSLDNNGYSFQPNALSDRVCDINNHLYKIMSHSGGTSPTMCVHYEGYPIIAPKPSEKLSFNLMEGDLGYQDLKNQSIWGTSKANRTTGKFQPLTNTRTTITNNPLSVDAINRLRDRYKIDWIPKANQESDLWELQITGLVKPQGYIDPSPIDYVPDALVAAIEQIDGHAPYEVFYIVWRTWGNDNILRLYTSLAQPVSNPPEGTVSSDNLIRVPKFAANSPLFVYLGMKYKEIFTISPQFTKHQFSVYAFARDANTISVPATPATLIAVDRRKPQPPLRPTLSDIGKADYHNLSEVTVSWGRAQGATYYQLYRATDSAIFAQDLESRRLKGNHYAGRTELDIFENNTTWFDAFRQKDAAAVAPALVRTLATMELPQLFGHVKGTPEWNNVTPIWQYWADWYYPSLRVNNTLDEIQALADLDGNQAAFTLLNSEPISELTYTDKVNGAVNNRYYYRLRSQGLNLSQSLWGLTSLGKAAAVPSVPPRTPVFTKVEAGDRQITLEWALNREPDLKGYVLYRSQNKDLLEDLRWFDVEFPQGSAAVQRIEIDDPRIVVRNGAIEISDALPIQSIVGVYRANEFDFKRPLSMAQVQAVNFRESERSFQHDSVAHTYRISLNRVADGVNMVVVVRSSLGFYTLLKYKHANYPYLDNSVQGLTTYFYKLLAKNSSNISSSNGEIQSAKAFEIEPPIVPEFTIIRATLGGVDEIVLRTIHLENLEVAIQKRQVGDNSWRRWIEWNTRSVFTDSNINRGHSIEYRILVRTLNKLVCTQPFQIESYPI